MPFIIQKLTAVFLFRLILSAINAINSLFVGLPLPTSIVYPKNEFKVSISPLSHAISIACRIALSTLDGVVENFFATVGYKIL